MPKASDIDVLRDVPLASLTTMRVGGRARYFVQARSDEEIIGALGWAKQHDATAWVLGGGSNVVIPDGGLDGLVVQIATRGVAVRDHEDVVEVTARAGEPWDDFVALSVEQDWAGIECLSAIPGLVGATPVQNVGAYGQAVSDSITRVSVYDRVEERVAQLTGRDCAFSYRDSLFKTVTPNRYVVLSVTFLLTPGGPPTVHYPELERRLDGRRRSLAEVRDTVIAIRAEKSMAAGHPDENARSCGSFFTNPIVSPDVADRVARETGAERMPRFAEPDGRVKLSAAWLIERAGFEKGYADGPVGLSTKHALAIVCHDGARAADVDRLRRTIQASVHERLGVELAPEPNLWSNESP